MREGKPHQDAVSQAQEAIDQIALNGNCHDFTKEELMMIRGVFLQANFPGQTCAAVGRFIEKVDRIINTYDSPRKV